jgi:hypothetical protein
MNYTRLLSQSLKVVPQTQSAQVYFSGQSILPLKPRIERYKIDFP